MKKRSLFFLLFLAINTDAQISKRKLDSLLRRIEVQHKDVKEWQDSFKKVQDSMQQLQVKPVTAPVVPLTKKELNARKWLWIGVTTALVLLVTALLRRGTQQRRD